MTNIDAIFNLRKVKFSKLDVLFSDLEIKEMVQKVNIFINLESLFRKIHNKYVEEQLISLQKKELKEFHMNLISNVLNLAAHYRLYFNKNKIGTNIVFYIQEMDKYVNLNNVQYCKNYRKSFIRKYTDHPELVTVNNVIRSTLNALDTIVTYVEDVYLVSSDRVESSVIPLALIDGKVLDGNLNLMVTTDPYDMQYVNKNFVIIYPAGEESMIVTKKNMFDVFRINEILTVEGSLPTYLLTFILSVIGDKNRGIDKVKGTSFNKVFKTLLKVYDKLGITDDDYIGFEELVSAIKDDPNNPNGNKKRVVDNYYATDLSSQVRMISKVQMNHLTDCLTNTYESGALTGINDKYFSMAPINVRELTQYKKSSGRRLFE